MCTSKAKAGVEEAEEAFICMHARMLKGKRPLRPAKTSPNIVALVKRGYR
jgi:hypothetical protein